jgi:hypothetical protein
VRDEDNNPSEWLRRSTRMNPMIHERLTSPWFSGSFLLFFTPRFSDASTDD